MTNRFYTRAVLILAAVASSRAAEPAAARWEGTVQIPGDGMKLVVDLDRGADGHWVGSAIVPGFGVKGAPLTGITVDSTNVAFTIKGALGEPTLKGRITPAGTLTGEFQQAGNSAPFTLENSGAPQVEPPRTSTVISKELEGEWQGAMEVLGNQVQVRLKLTSQPSGPAKAEFRLIGRRDTTLPFELVIQDGDSITIESESTGLIYEGMFNKAGRTIDGTFRQGPLESTLVLRRPSN